MATDNASYKAHCLVLPYPLQGHINPLLQFSKRLLHKGLRVTFVTTKFISTTLHQTPPSSISVETISDGYDEGGARQAPSFEVYLDSFHRVGSQTLGQLVEKLNSSSCPLSCIVYDSFLSWPLDVAKQFGLVSAMFLTQSCAVDATYYFAQVGLLKLPLQEAYKVLHLPGLPPLLPRDLPSFLCNNYGLYPALFDMLVHQFSQAEQADWLLCNTFYELEKEVEGIEHLQKLWKLRAIGPNIPSVFLDQQLQEDKDYGFSIFRTDKDSCLKWLNNQKGGSVVYVSFGSIAELEAQQMLELAAGLSNTDFKFLWVVRASEMTKLPENFLEDTSEKGLVVNWCPQLEVLGNEAIGCFVTHCGWNSTLEALSLGVPMVAVPHFSDQSTNAKYVVDVWRVGVRAEAGEGGVVGREEIEGRVTEVMEGDSRGGFKRNCEKWKDLARAAMCAGGSSDMSIQEFVNDLSQRVYL